MNRVTKVKKEFFTVRDVRLTSLNAKYAVRGKVPQKAQEIAEKLKQLQEQNGGVQNEYPFDSITQANIGNPQVFGQPPLSFNRQVLAGILCPDLVDQGKIENQDVVNRVKFYQKNIQGNVGAYTESQGYSFGRKSVSEFIKRRDGLKEGPAIKDLILLQGASEGVVLAFSTFIQQSTDGIMIPIPQYPLYSAQITLHGGSQINYYLDEKSKWSCSVQELEQQYKDAKGRGVNPKILCVINPGNPTGTVLSYENIQEMIKFAYDHKMLLIADEVYQENIYVEGQKFYSFNKVMNEMPAPYNEAPVISLHSTSKGLIGECGIRGGYMQLANIDPQVQAELVKLKSINLCTGTIGQLTTDLMTNFPRENAGYSDETIRSHQQEIDSLFKGLQERSKLITEYLNKMENIETQPAEAAMYAFPRIYFSEKCIQEAKSKGMEPDLFYCLEVLEKTGLVIVPGSGFGQEPGTYHFRITNLIRPVEKFQEVMDKFSKFNSEFHARYK